MATIGKITTASSGSAAIDYAYGRNKMPAATKDWLKRQGVDPATVEQLQNRAVVMSGLNVDPEYAKTQMKATRMAYSTRGKQTTRVIQSFPTIDLDPANPHDWQTANQLGLELAKQAFPDYQVAIYTQLDGSGHKLHNHIIVNMPNLKTGEKYHEHQSWQRLSRINDEISREYGLSIIDRNTRAPERRTMAERQIDAKNEYVWKDDLRSRIDKAILDSPTSSYKDFSEYLARSGIIIHDRGKNFSYEFLDADKKHRRARGKTLGGDYEKETILNELERQNRQPATELPRLVEPSRQIKQREQHFESRKPTIIQSGRSIDRLTRTVGQTQQTARAVANNLNRQSRRKRRFRDRITSFKKHFAGIRHQIRQFIQQNVTLKRLKAQLAKTQQIATEAPEPITVNPQVLPRVKATDEPILQEILSKSTVPMVNSNTMSELMDGFCSVGTLVNHDTLMKLSDETQWYVYDHLTDGQLNNVIHSYHICQKNTHSLAEFQANQHNLDIVVKEVNERGYSLTSFTHIMDKLQRQATPPFRPYRDINH